MYKKYYRTPISQRNEILREYLTSDLNCRELGEKYGLRHATVYKWVCRYLNQKKVVPLQSEPRPVVELQNLALNTLIDVAERNGIAIRKKSGAKQ